MSEPGTVRDRIEWTLRHDPGQTASRLAAALFQDSRATSRLQFELAVLLSRGRIHREGVGGIRDPHRYYLSKVDREAARAA